MRCISSSTRKTWFLFWPRCTVYPDVTFGDPLKGDWGNLIYEVTLQKLLNSKIIEKEILTDTHGHKYTNAYQAYIQNKNQTTRKSGEMYE